jgi:parallel beta-helix repeat protein
MKKICIAWILSFAFCADLAVAIPSSYVVTNLNDSGPGSLRTALISANTANGNVISFDVAGTITLSSSLPAITKTMTLDGTTAPGFAGAPVVAINFNGRPGLVLESAATSSLIRALSFVGASKAGLTLKASNVTVQDNYIGLLPNGAPGGNLGDGLQILSSSEGNLIGRSQATVGEVFQLSNVISANGGNGITLSGSRNNVIAMNYIGTDVTGTTSAGYGNGKNGLWITKKSSDNLIGGQAAGLNNPTGSQNPANAVFQRPPQGNLISGNAAHGVLIDDASTLNVLSGNYIGTDTIGTSALGNGLNGVMIEKASSNSLLGGTATPNPFACYNVIAGNGANGLRINNADLVTVQGNFLGLGADNATSVPNGQNGLLVSGSSRKTQVGGVFPLGNVISGNTLHGLEVRDKVSEFVSLNNFVGLGAFQTFASPNGLNGFLVTSTGSQNTIRGGVISGNTRHGIEITGKASGVQVLESAIGTNGEISAALPNQGCGIVLGGSSQNNAIGGLTPLTEPRMFISGNKEYGILVRDKAQKNTIYHSTIGLGAGSAGAIPNEWGGILLDEGTKSTTIGGTTTPLQNVIQSNLQAGLTIHASTKNSVLNNTINSNDVVGVYGLGNCAGTQLITNTIQNNGAGGTNNVDLSGATGISVSP